MALVLNSIRVVGSHKRLHIHYHPLRIGPGDFFNVKQHAGWVDHSNYCLCTTAAHASLSKGRNFGGQLILHHAWRQNINHGQSVVIGDGKFPVVTAHHTNCVQGGAYCPGWSLPFPAILVNFPPIFTSPLRLRVSLVRHTLEDPVPFPGFPRLSTGFISMPFTWVSWDTIGLLAEPVTMSFVHFAFESQGIATTHDPTICPLPCYISVSCTCSLDSDVPEWRFGLKCPPPCVIEILAAFAYPPSLIWGSCSVTC